MQRKLAFWALVLTYVFIVIPTSAACLYFDGWFWKIMGVWTLAIFPMMLADTYRWAQRPTMD